MTQKSIFSGGAAAYRPDLCRHCACYFNDVIPGCYLCAEHELEFIIATGHSSKDEPKFAGRDVTWEMRDVF